jgi:hypothetical protein
MRLDPRKSLAATKIIFAYFPYYFAVVPNWKESLVPVDPSVIPPGKKESSFVSRQEYLGVFLQYLEEPSATGSAGPRKDERGPANNF